MQKTSQDIENLQNLVKSVLELQDLSLFYLRKYRYDPFMQEEHREYFEEIKKVIQELHNL